MTTLNRVEVQARSYELDSYGHINKTTGTYHAALHAARAAARLAPELTPRVAATVRENLRLAFGRADGALVRAVYRHFAEAAVDLLFFNRLFDADRPGRHFVREGDGWDHYRKNGTEAAVFVTGHFGNWEIFGASLKHVGIPVIAVARTPDAAWLARWIARFRSEHMAETIDKTNAGALALKALRRGACVAFLMDQSAGRHGVTLPFFGVPTSTVVLPAALAIKCGVPLYAGYSTRLGDGLRYRCYAQHVPVGGDAEAVTARLNRILEGYVRRDPEQWWWFHRRFKPRRLLREGRDLSPAGIPLSR